MILNAIGSAARSYVTDTASSVKQNYFTKMGLSRTLLGMAAGKGGIIGNIAARSLDNLEKFSNPRKEEKQEVQEVKTVQTPESSKQLELLQQIAENTSQPSTVISMPMNRAARRSGTGTQQPSSLVTKLMGKAGIGNEDKLEAEQNQLERHNEIIAKFDELIDIFKGDKKESDKGIFSKITDTISSIFPMLGKFGTIIGSLIAKAGGLVAAGAGVAAGGIKNFFSSSSKIDNSSIANTKTEINSLDGPDKKVSPASKPSIFSKIADKSKDVAKSAGGLLKTGGKAAIKKIPIIGALAGLGFAAQRLASGDVVGASLEVASGVASTVPGVGTALSLAADATLAARDNGVFEDVAGKSAENKIPDNVTAKQTALPNIAEVTAKTAEKTKVIREEAAAKASGKAAGEMTAPAIISVGNKQAAAAPSVGSITVRNTDSTFERVLQQSFWGRVA